MQEILELAQNTTQPLMMIWIQSDGGGRPVLIRYLDAIIWGPAQGVQTLLPQPSMAWALSVHGDSKPLYNRWNVMK